MCLMLYLATEEALTVEPSPDLRLEPVEASRDAVRQWLSLPVVQFVGAHTGCSCGFPSVSADEPVDYFDGIFREGEERDADLRSVRAFLDVVRTHLVSGTEVQWLAVWNGEEDLAPKGTLNVDLASLEAETFVLNERFVYRVSRGEP